MSYMKSYKLLAIGGIILLAASAFAKDSKLRITVEPSQAYVLVDGVPSGSGNQTIKVTAGTHSVGVYNYGFTLQVRDVSVEEGTITGVEFKLEPVAGKVTGPWGRIQIEGASHAAILLNGKTPDYIVGHGDEFNHNGAFLNCCRQELVVPAGKHTVTILDKGGQERWSGVVDVPANERVIINANNGDQKVKPWPEGANISSLSRFNAGRATSTVAIAPVSGSLSAAPGKINCGDTAKLSWTTAETVERAITAGTETSKQSAPAGDLSVQPKETTDYTLQASGPGGSFTSTTKVDVNTAVQSSLQASPGEIRYRRIGDKVLEQGSANLNWSATNASSASVEPFGAVNVNDSRSLMATPKQQAEGPLNEVQTYTLNAKNECGGSDTQTASVRIVGSIEPIPEVPLVSVFFPTGHPDAKHPGSGVVRSQQEALAKAAAGFKKYLEYDPDAKLTVLGNTDVRDSNARNKPLSQRRADHVKAYLVSQGIPESKIETIAQGKEHPLDANAVKLLHEQNPNKPPKSLGTFQELVWAYNRRADLVLMPKEARSTQFFPGTAPEAKQLFSPGWPEERAHSLLLASEKEQLPVESDSQKK
jgi:outer membrane protein OmpA-like peptidoglycan-associated protein